MITFLTLIAGVGGAGTCETAAEKEAPWSTTASRPSVSNDARQAECPLCLAELPIEYFPRLATCAHRSCFDCFQQYLRIEISESRISVACPECSEPMHPNGKILSIIYYTSDLNTVQPNKRGIRVGFPFFYYSTFFLLSYITVTPPGSSIRLLWFSSLNKFHNDGKLLFKLKRVGDYLQFITLFLLTN